MTIETNGPQNAWQSAPVALGIVDSDLRLVEANQRLLELFACSAGEGLDRPITDLFDTDEGVAERLRDVARSREAGPVAATFNGSPVVLTCWPVQGQEELVAMACYDPTAVGLKHPGAHERFRLLAAAVEEHPDAVFIKDCAGRHLLTNPACADIIGRPAEEILGQDMRELFPPEIAEEMREYDRRVIEGGEAVTMEEAIPHRGRGELRILRSHKIPYRDEDGSIIGLMGFARDVTEQRQAEAGLRESEQKFRRLVEQATDGFFLHDEKGNFLDVNEQACRSLGYTRDELLEMNVADVDISWPTERIRNEWDTVLQALPITLEGVHRRKDGSTFPVEVRIGWFEAGEERHVLALARDITDRKAAEEQLEAARLQLEERVRERTKDLEEANRQLSREIEERRSVEQKLRASRRDLRRHRSQLETLAGGLLELQESDRRQLAGELHDDLTQRLAALSIAAGRLRESNGELDPGLVEGLDAITRQCVELSVDIHRMARRLHPSILDDLGVVDAIRAECEMFQERYGIESSCKAGAMTELLPQQAALCLYRVVQESLNNVGQHSGASRVEVRVREEDGKLLLVVSDDGKGFSTDQTPAGLGLISMQERVRRLKGSFRIESTPDGGTRLRIELPA